MKYILSLFVLLSVNLLATAQNSFEGTLDITMRNDDKVTEAELKIKGDKVFIRQMQGGNKKYSYFVVDLNSRDLYTVSTAEKKVIIKYHLDSLLSFYEKNNLKDGFKNNYGLEIKLTDKTKDENGFKVTKATGEDDIYRVTAWVTPSPAPLKSLIPLLRLLGDWNELNGTDLLISSCEITNKVSKKESVAKVVVKKEPIPASLFVLPKEYLMKDFSKLMQELRNNKDLPMLIQAFADF